MSDHTELIERLRTQADYQREVGPTKHIMLAAADALGDSVPRKQHEEAVHTTSIQQIAMRRLSTERDEARAERDALAAQRDRLLAVGAEWDQAYNDPFTLGTHPFTRELRHVYEVPDGEEKAAQPASLVQHDADLWDAAAAFVDEQREDFDGDLRQVRDRMRDHADWVRQGSGK
jgi:hypothetical protein